MSVTQPHKTLAHERARRIALFGGSFDPIHAGHVAVARAAQRRYNLDEVLFIPSGRPPHKQRQELAAFAHRYAMVALACADHAHFVASLAEAGPDGSGRTVSYSIDTVRHFRHVFHQRGDHLYFIVGADAFLKFPTWKEYEALLNSSNFIVANRPGFRLDALRLVIPPELLGRPAPGSRNGGERPETHTIALRRTSVHFLATVASSVSATEVRRRIRSGQSIHELVPARVEEYIEKQGLYR